MGIVEGVQNVRWSYQGRRLVDTKEWCELYCAWRELRRKEDLAWMKKTKPALFREIKRIVRGSKTQLITLTLAVLALAGCATEPKNTCVLLKFQHTPSRTVIETLAQTQPASDRQAILAWFQVQNETGFILRGDHTNAIAAAIADGATATVIHQGGSSMLVSYGKR